MYAHVKAGTGTEAWIQDCNRSWEVDPVLGAAGWTPGPEPTRSSAPPAESCKRRLEAALTKGRWSDAGGGTLACGGLASTQCAGDRSVHVVVAFDCTASQGGRPACVSGCHYCALTGGHHPHASHVREQAGGTRPAHALSESRCQEPVSGGSRPPGGPRACLLQLRPKQGCAPQSCFLCPFVSGRRPPEVVSPYPALDGTRLQQRRLHLPRAAGAQRWCPASPPQVGAPTLSVSPA